MQIPTPPPKGNFMTWNIRLVRENEVVRLKEVYYEGNMPQYCTQNSIAWLEGEAPITDWCLMINAAFTKPILDFPFSGQQLELPFDGGESVSTGM